MVENLFLYIVGFLILLAAAFLLGRASRRLAGEEKAGDLEPLRRQARELSRELKKAQDELARKQDLSIKIPNLVRRLSEKLPPSAIPGIAVRFMKDFFRASRAGFFTPLGDGKEFTLTEGVGFPEEWKESVRLPADQGMLGMVVQKRIVVSRDEYLALRGKERLGTSPLERAVGVADLIAPVTGPSGIVGVIVIAGCAAEIRDERSYASMLVDLLGSAFRSAAFLQSAETEASADPLTGLSNRRHFAEWFEAEIRQARNYIQPMSLLLFDIDHFKKINDSWGHPAGDLVLKKLAEITRSHTRSSDLVARYGGEEFAVVMASSSRDQALSYAECLRRLIASAEFRIPGQASPIKITISGGIATFPADGESASGLIQSADEALFAAKQQGRNRICKARKVGLDGKPLDE